MQPKRDPKDIEIKIRVSRELLNRIESFWHRQQLKSRQAAVVVLLERALKAKEPTQVETSNPE